MHPAAVARIFWRDINGTGTSKRRLCIGRSGRGALCSGTGSAFAESAVPVDRETGNVSVLGDDGQSSVATGADFCFGQTGAAKQYVAEALAEERGLSVEDVILTQKGESAALTAELSYGNERLSVTLDLRM